MEHQWKITRDDMKINGCDDSRQWAIAVQNLIDSVININQYNVQESDILLVFHFQYIEVDLDEN